MSFLLGTDEAGYGPNLGPLLISASVWEVPSGVRGDHLYQRLQTVIAPAATRSARVLANGLPSPTPRCSINRAKG